MAFDPGPDGFSRIEFGGVGRQVVGRDVWRPLQGAGSVPPGVVEDQHAVLIGGQALGDLFEQQGHCGGVAAWQEEADVVTPVRKERTEEIADLVFGLARDAGASPPGSPQSAKHAMLAEVALVLKGYPDFLLRMGPGDFLEKRGVVVGKLLLLLVGGPVGMFRAGRYVARPRIYPCKE